jgi:hypothetical protein
MAKDELEFKLEDIMVGLGTPTIEDNLPSSYDFGDDEPKDKDDEKEDNELKDFDINKQLANKDDDDSEEDTSKTPSPNVGLNNTDNSESYALAFARYQLERGNLTNLDEEALLKVVEEQGEDEAIAWLFQNEVDLNREAIRDEIRAEYDDDIQEYLKLRDKGVDGLKAKDIASVKRFYDNVDKDDLEDDKNEGLRSDIIADWYKRTTRLSDAKIKKLVENHVALGEDIEVAKDAVDEVRNILAEDIKQYEEYTKKQQKEFEEANRKQLEQLKQRVESMDEVLPGYKINKQTKDKIHEMIVKPVAQDANGNPLNAIWKKRLEDPFKFDTMIAYLEILGVFDGKVDKLLKPAKNAAVSDLSTILATKKFGSKPAQGGGNNDLLGSLGGALNVK